MQSAVLVVDDHDLFGSALAEMLSAKGTADVADVALNAAEALDMYEPGKYDLILTDLDLGDSQDGFYLLARVLEQDPEAHVVIVSARDDADLVSAAVHGGAVGYFTKGMNLDELHQKVELAIQGKAVFDTNAANSLAAATRQGPTVSLTSRERDVITAMSHGLTMNEIADSLYISIDTVKDASRRAYRKLKVNSQAHAVATCLRKGIIS